MKDCQNHPLILLKRIIPIIISILIYPTEVSATINVAEPLLPDTLAAVDIDTEVLLPGAPAEDDSLKNSLKIIGGEVELRHHSSTFTSISQNDSDMKPEEEATDTNRNWWYLLSRGKLDLKDKSVEWPRFLRFCLGVYNWGDQFFNGFDTTYVVGTGRRWKARVTTDAWTDSYQLKLGNHKPIEMLSHSVIHSGPYLQFMAVSLGYQFDMTNIIGKRPIDNRRLTFGFGCGLFSIDLAYTENDGGTYLRRFSDWDNGKIINVFFPGLKMKSLETDIYFFINHRKYSQVAAYGFGRYQKKAAGSMLVGFSYLGQNIDMDFTTLPYEMIKDIGPENEKLTYNYYNFNFLVGYAHNWPVGNHLLFNITALPAVGWNHRVTNEGIRTNTLFSCGIRGQGGVTYNYDDFFAGLSGKVTGQYYYGHTSALISWILTAQLTFGVRF